MRAKIAVLLVLFTSSHPAFSQVFTTQDTSFATAGAGIAGYVVGKTKYNLLDAQMKREASAFEADIIRQSKDVENLLNEAKTVEVGKPNPQARSIYTGKFVEAREYNQYAGSSEQMKSNKYRLQGSGAEKLADSLLQEKALVGQKITLELQRVHGTLDGSQIRMAASTTLTGTVEEVARQFVEVAHAQSPTQAPGSIVRVELRYATVETPNPALAEQMRAKAAKLNTKVEADRAKVKPEIDAVEKKYAGALKKMKMLRRGGITLFLASIALGFVRDNFAQNMITLANACVDADQMNTLTTTVSVQTEMDADDVAYDLREMCAQ